MAKASMVIIGSGAWGEATAELALKCGYSVVGFIDDNWADQGQGPRGLPVEGPINSSLAQLSPGTTVAVALSDNHARHRIMQTAWSRGLQVPSLISPLASVSISATLATGVILHDFAHVWTAAKIGFATTLGPHATVSHHAEIGEGCRLLEGSHVGAGVSLGNFSSLATGAIVASTVGHAPDGTTLDAGGVLVRHVQRTSRV